ncbi:MAG TPA: hypothetical protein VFU79_05860 [Nitrososphaeraceae archaeon]|nr:hypothetical protein [Nitrososphaeraceae archaeon]
MDSNISNIEEEEEKEKYVINLWKAFCKSRKALSIEYNATDAVINKWNNRFFNISSIEQIKNYIKENITIEGHVLDDPF